MHPYHPLCGKEFELIHYSKSWGEDRVHFYDEQGEHYSLPASWTDIGPEDPFVKISQGRSYFRFKDLLALAELVQQIQQEIESEPGKM